MPSAVSIIQSMAPYIGITVGESESPQRSYLPVVTKWTKDARESDPRDRLLNALTENDIIPFTAVHETVFARCSAISAITARYLGKLGFAIVIGMGAAGGLAGVRIAKYSGVPDESPLTDVIPYVISAAVGVGLGIAGMVFTGTLPDSKSDAADAKERACLELRDQFDEAGMRLVSLFWSKKPEKFAQAQSLAREIQSKLPQIKAKLSAAIQFDDKNEGILDLLNTAVDYVMSSASKKVILSKLEGHIAAERLKKQRKIPPCLSEASLS